MKTKKQNTTNNHKLKKSKGRSSQVETFVRAETKVIKVQFIFENELVAIYRYNSNLKYPDRLIPYKDLQKTSKNTIEIVRLVEEICNDIIKHIYQEPTLKTYT